MSVESDGLDEFSRSFADALFAEFPELRAAAKVENGLLQIELKPGLDRPDCVAWVSTQGGEITIGFGMFHAHFDWPARQPWPEDDPIRFLRSLMREETLIEDWTLDGRWSGSGILATDEEPDLSGMRPGHVVYVRSWSGARDRRIQGE